MSRVLQRLAALAIVVAGAAASMTMQAQPRRLAWICPNMPHDFGNLFLPGAAWTNLKRSTDVFKLYIGKLASADTTFIDNAVAALNQAHIKVAVEAGGLRPFSGCDSMAGENHAISELASMRSWLNRGGTIDYIVMDSPINTMIATGAPGNCGMTVTQAANELADYMHAVRAVIPNVHFGWIEPVPWYTVGQYPNHPGNNYGDLPKVMDTVVRIIAQHGDSLEFFHADSPYEYSESQITHGWDKLKEMERHTRAKGLRFGLIFNSEFGGLNDDSTFYARTMDGWLKYGAAGGDPQDVIVQSWYPLPTTVLAESTRYSFTFDALQFFLQAGINGPRTNGVDVHGAVQAGNVSVLPNPVASEGLVRFTLAGEEHVAGELFDMRGARAATLFEGTYSGGPHTVGVDLSGVPAGIYRCRVLQGSRAAETMVVIAR
ncbi:MAG TPA: hypothetical protein VHI13_14760 [Candidatus Kapabacteria bacterium]|nr:hypothetical protein [Candidatus Kapabacteria bacterium]